MPEKSLRLRLRERFNRAETFVKRDLWLGLPERRGPRVLYKLIRMGVLIFEGFVKSDVFMLAAALTYQVIFALVPLLVVMLAVIKGFGGFSALGGQVQKFVLSYITPQAQDDLAGKIDAFISNVNGAAIGAIGFAALLYTSLSLLDTIEKVFNRIWGVRTRRALLRRFTVYWTFLTVSPILLAVSLSMTGFVQSHHLYHWMKAHAPMVDTAVLVLAPFVVAWIMFTGFYIFMPNTRVHPGAALIGGLVSGTAWEGMKSVYFWYNTKVVTSYAFYGSLGSIPVFLLWIYLSWIIVLFGAEVAFAVQHVGTYKREIEELRLSAADRDRVSLLAAVEAARPFLAGQNPPTGEEVAFRINMPVRVVNELLYQLTSQGVLREVTPQGQKESGYLPARDPGLITARDVVAAVRSYGDECTLPSGPQAQTLFQLIDRAEAEATRPLSEISLRDLAQRMQQTGGTPQPDAGGDPRPATGHQPI